MSSFNHEANLLTLRKRLLESSLTSADVAYENVHFDPGSKSVWVQEFYVEVDERQFANQTIMATGTVVYEVHVPRGTGTAAASALAKEIMDLFLPGTSIVNGSHEVQIVRAERLRGSMQPSDGKWYTVPVRITWRGYAFLT